VVKSAKWAAAELGLGFGFGRGRGEWRVEGMIVGSAGNAAM
jgi:hypothetical protein